MLVSISFWVFCAIVGVSLRFVPIVNQYWWLHCAIYYVISMFCKTRFFFKQADPNLRADNQTVIVTGASAGIGAQTAMELAKRGAKVIWAARTTSKAVHIKDKFESTRTNPSTTTSGVVLPLDLADLTSIENFAHEVKKVAPKLDCLILNAAYHGPQTFTKDGFEQNFGVNHLGHMYLTYLLLDLLEASQPSRIVIVSSDLHRLCWSARFDDLMYKQEGSYVYSGFGPYNHSKLCNVLFMRELAKRLKGTGITVHACHPGTPVQSNLMRSNIMGSDFMSQVCLPPIYHLFCRKAKDGAQTLIHCALHEQCAKETGKYFENVQESRPSKCAMDPGNAVKLWNLSCDLLKIDHNWA